MNKRQALDLIAWVKLKLQHCDSDKVFVPKSFLADLLALAERAPLRGGANVKSGREHITEAMIWYRLRAEFRKRRNRRESTDDAVKGVRDEFSARYPQVLQPFGEPLSDATIKDQLTRRTRRRRRRR